MRHTKHTKLTKFTKPYFSVYNYAWTKPTMYFSNDKNPRTGFHRIS